MQDEIKSLEDNPVWDIVERTDNVKIIKSKWVYNTKKRNENDDIKFKARLVAEGRAHKRLFFL